MALYGMRFCVIIRDILFFFKRYNFYLVFIDYYQDWGVEGLFFVIISVVESLRVMVVILLSINRCLNGFFFKYEVFFVGQQFLILRFKQKKDVFVFEVLGLCKIFFYVKFIKSMLIMRVGLIF